jgi:hypothetical protein
MNRQAAIPSKELLSFELASRIHLNEWLTRSGCITCYQIVNSYRSNLVSTPVDVFSSDLSNALESKIPVIGRDRQRSVDNPDRRNCSIMTSFEWS